MGERLISWFTYNFMFALVPVAAPVVVLGLADKLTLDALARSPGVLFFALMVSASTLGDLSRFRLHVGRGLMFEAFHSILLIGAVISALLYGTLLHDTVVGPGSEGFRSGLLTVSLLLGGFLFVVATIVQVILGRITAP